MSTEAQRAEPHSWAYNLGLIALAVALAGVALAYAIDAARRNSSAVPHRLDAETTLTRTLGGAELDVPLSWFRYAEQRVEGFARQIDLRLVLPLGAAGELLPIDVTLLPRSRVRPSSALLDGVYLHMFDNTQLQGPPGLVGKPLHATEGYAGETIWYDALSADPFVAKCSAPVFDAAEARCLRTVYLEPGIAAIYAFGADVLPRWRDFDTILGERLRLIGVD